MTDREKLIALIATTKYGRDGNSVLGANFQPGFIQKIADNLIGNGVTFAKDTNVGSKWTPASQPPEVSRDEKGTLVNYLVYMPKYGVNVGNYIKPGKFWICLGIPCNVTHWMPLPVPPKEGHR